MKTTPTDRVDDAERRDTSLFLYLAIVGLSALFVLVLLAGAPMLMGR